MHFTQNPIGSDDQLDLQDNAISFDYAMNSPAALWQDRFGKQHKTVQQALKDVGFKPAGFDFISGGTLGIGDRDKCVFYPTDGYWYSWNGKLPYVVPANSSPTPGGKKGWGVIVKEVFLAEDLKKPGGSNLVGFSPKITYDPVSVGFRLAQTTYITDYPYLADKSGKVPFRESAQKAIDDVFQRGGGVVVIPDGDFLMDTVPLIPRDGVKVIGYGERSRIVVNTDTSVFEYLALKPDSVLFGFELESVFIDNAVTGVRNKFDILLENPNFCKITKVRVKSGHTDTVYSESNVGGIHLRKSLGSTTTTFCNWIDDCWVQNNSIWFENLTDSRIKGGYVWGHTRQYSIRITGGGANAIESVVGIIPSKYKGGVWLDGIGVNQIRIIGNEFDGNPMLDTGPGIFAPQQVITCLVSNNTFWGCDKQGIHLVDPVGWSVTGNNFWKCNAADAGFDDILVEGKTFSPNGNVFSDNTHVIDDTRVNPGFVFRELNSGFTPGRNIVSGGGIYGNYKQPAINTGKVPGNQTVVSNCVGGDMDGLSQNLNSIRTKRIIDNSFDGLINPNSSITITINTETQFDHVGGYVGVLSVSTTRQNFIEQSTNENIAVVSRGNTINKNVLVSMDGTSGRMGYTITVQVPGTLTFTNTTNEIADVRLVFSGVTSLA